jgi:hypothetical protein|tara:strand:- start:578 stop:712 length:135 start_codon:yes stop_codon:yes gene_type:complete
LFFFFRKDPVDRILGCLMVLDQDVRKALSATAGIGQSFYEAERW